MGRETEPDVYRALKVARKNSLLGALWEFGQRMAEKRRLRDQVGLGQMSEFRENSLQIPILMGIFCPRPTHTGLHTPPRSHLSLGHKAILAPRAPEGSASC
jgi:hypothetical protein